MASDSLEKQLREAIALKIIHDMPKMPNGVFSSLFHLPPVPGTTCNGGLT